MDGSGRCTFWRPETCSRRGPDSQRRYVHLSGSSAHSWSGMATLAYPRFLSIPAGRACCQLRPSRRVLDAGQRHHRLPSRRRFRTPSHRNPHRERRTSRDLSLVFRFIRCRLTIPLPALSTVTGGDCQVPTAQFPGARLRRPAPLVQAGIHLRRMEGRRYVSSILSASG